MSINSINQNLISLNPSAIRTGLKPEIVTSGFAGDSVRLGNSNNHSGTYTNTGYTHQAGESEKTGKTVSMKDRLALAGLAIGLPAAGMLIAGGGSVAAVAIMAVVGAALFLSK
ncbi:MAG: hypothetical protein LWY06_00685 [Firmicutes bacterium]|nr:hypothetical protein [Bacillota bacterium]